jgi:hypothetical protein
VLRGLARDREERWPTVRAYVNALQAVAPGSGHTLLVSPPEPSAWASPAPDPATEPTPSAPAGSRVLLALMCLVAFLACFGGALVVTQQLR